MPVVVTMHACSTCPVYVNFAIFRCYLAGCSVDEAVEHVISLEKQSHEPAATPFVSTNTASSSQADGLSNSAQPLGEELRPHVKAPPDESPLQQEDGRQDADESPCALLPPEDTLEVATLVADASAVASTKGTKVTGKGSIGEVADDYPVNPVDGDRRLSKEAARAPTVVPEGEGEDRGPGEERPLLWGKEKAKSRRRAVKHSKRRHHSTGHGHGHGAAGTAGGGGGEYDELRERRRKRGHHHHHHHSDGGGRSHLHPSGSLAAAKPHSVFARKDYLSFQRRLQEAVESGPSLRAPLSSDMLFLEATEQYRLYELLIQEDFLSAPYAFLTKHYLPIGVADRRRLVEMYYEADSKVFQYFFGDKMQKFEPADSSRIGSARSRKAGLGHASTTTATAGAAGAAGAGGALSQNGNGDDGKGNGNATTAAVAGLLSLWGAREHPHEAKAVADPLCVSVPSLKRQWENIRRVCLAMVNMYLGKSDTLVPRGMSLLEAVRQCYGIRGELAVSYTSAVFGFYHRLTTRLLDALNGFTGYSTLCNVLAAQWCDQSLLLLDERFVDRCRRIGKLLDENRVLAEMHQLLFGEALRPRWQVQLDEVQRAIITTTATEKAAAAALSNIISSAQQSQPTVTTTTTAAAPSHSASATFLGVLGGSPAASAPAPPALSLPSTAAGAAASPPLPNRGASASPPPPPPPPPDHSSTALHPLSSQPSVLPFASSFAFSPFLSGTGHSNYSPTGAATTASGAPAAVAAAAAGGGGWTTGAQHSPLCANKQFSRRFMLEYTYIMRHLCRTALQIGVNASINDALEVFYVRIFTFLDGLSTRSALTAVSLVAHSAAAAAAAAAANNNNSSSTSKSTTAVLPTSASITAHSPALPTAKSHALLTTPFGDTPYPLPMGRGEGGRFAAGGSNAGGVGASHSGEQSLSSLPQPFRAHLKLPRVSSVPVLPSEAVTAPGSVGDDGATDYKRSKSSSVTEASPLGNLFSSTSSPRADEAPAVDPITTVVNASTLRPMTSLLPFPSFTSVPTGQQQQQQQHHHHSSCLDEAGHSGGGVEMVEGSVSVEGGGGGGGAAAASGGGPPFDPTALGRVMLKVVDKHYLRELSMFLSLLPGVWQQAHSLSADDHAACDGAFTDFVVALKAVTQILMAAEDFH